LIRTKLLPVYSRLISWQQKSNSSLSPFFGIPLLSACPFIRFFIRFYAADLADPAQNVRLIPYRIPNNNRSPGGKKKTGPTLSMPA
jgi:hypothetical protein